MKTPASSAATPELASLPRETAQPQPPTHRLRHVAPALALGLLALAAAAPTATAQPSLAAVTPTTMAQTGWSQLAVGDTGIDFVAAPSGGTFLPGSVQFSIGDPRNAGGHLQLTNAAFTFEVVRLVSLRYQTYVTASPLCDRKNTSQRRSIHVALDVDTDGDLSADRTLVFDPALNGTVECGVWQNWDAKNGLWYWADDRHGPRNAATLANLLVTLPDAKLVLGGIRFFAGAGGHEWKNFVASLDGVSLEGPPRCTVTPEGITCVSGPAPYYDFGPDAP